MRFQSISLAALVIGAVSWFWLFGIAFNTPTDALWPAVAVPLFLHTGAIALFCIYAHRSWVWVVGFSCLPHLVMHLTCFTMVFNETGDVEWGYIRMLVIWMVVTSVIAGLTARLGGPQ